MPGVRSADVISEIGGPAPLLTAMLLEVGLMAGAVLPTVVAVITMGVLPYAVTVALARAGRVGDRFVADRRQRTPILVGTLVVFVLGAVAVWALDSPAALRALVITAVCGLLVVTLITLFWKISVHATLAAMFAGLQIVLFGGWGLFGLFVLAAVLWGRHRLQAHTIAQLAAGTALGATLSLCYALAVSIGH